MLKAKAVERLAQALETEGRGQTQEERKRQTFRHLETYCVGKKRERGIKDKPWATDLMTRRRFV